MVNSQEIIERSVYDAILKVTIALGYSLDPNKYLPVSIANKEKLERDLKKLKKYIEIYGVGNNESRGKKVTPRIVIDSKGFYPGDVGLPKEIIEKEVGIGFTVTEEPYETIDQFIDVTLVANNQEDMRLLHQILFWSIPQRGYIKPYTSKEFLFSGNIFIENVNFFDFPELDTGLLEKTYQFQVKDCLIGEKLSDVEIVPIKNISFLIDEYGLNLEINSQ